MINVKPDTIDIRAPSKKNNNLLETQGRILTHWSKKDGYGNLNHYF